MQKIWAGCSAAVSIAGAWVSGILIRTHIEVSIGGTGSGLCDISETLNCAAAASSDWSTLFGVPIAVLGLAFYLASLVTIVWGVFAPKLFHPAGSSLLQVGWLGSVLYSVLLGIVSLTVLDAVCPFCAALYLVNALGLVFVSLWLQQAPHKPVLNPTEWLSKLTSQATVWAFVISFLAAVISGTAYTNVIIAETEAQAAALSFDRDARATLYDVLDDTTPVVGASEPSLVLVEFANFQCGFCARFSNSVAAVMDEFSDQLQVGFRHFPAPGHEYSRQAAIAAVCAQRQDKFYEMKTALFNASPQLDPNTIARLARNLSLDMDEFELCLRDPSADEFVSADQDAGRRAGVNATPTFFINGRRYEGHRDPDDLRSILRTELRRLQE